MVDNIRNHEYIAKIYEHVNLKQYCCIQNIIILCLIFDCISFLASGDRQDESTNGRRIDYYAQQFILAWRWLKVILKFQSLMKFPAKRNMRLTDYQKFQYTFHNGRNISIIEWNKSIWCGATAATPPKIRVPFPASNNRMSSRILSVTSIIDN